MNFIDDTELEILQHTGDIQLAECVGLTLWYATDIFAAVIGVPAQALLQPIDYPPIHIDGPHH
jgi:hypothetical protein